MSDQNYQSLFTCSQSELWDFYIGAGEAAQEADCREVQKDNEAFYALLDAIGIFRFGRNWKDIGDEDGPDLEADEYYRQCAIDQQAEYDSRWPIHEMPQY